MNKTAVHFTDNYLLTPTNPITVNLIGIGGTGSQMLTALARTNHALIALGHAGLHVTAFDSDKVTEANLGRQLFAETELGLHKASALINRINRFFGTNWKAENRIFNERNIQRMHEHGAANIYISCVDSIASRFDIAKAIKHACSERYHRNQPLYWMDLGNSRYTGQVILSTIGEIRQPQSEKFNPIAKLPQVTEEYKNLLEGQSDNEEPSCSLAEALEKQDLFINSTLANMGSSLLWQLFREGMITNRGFFLNLKDFRTQPLKVA